MGERVYIAGPMRGYEFYNFTEFDIAAQVIRSRGDHPVSPADLDRQHGFDGLRCGLDTDWNTVPPAFDLYLAMRRDLDALETCTRIVLLPGWENSRGAKLELATAQWHGLKVEDWTVRPCQEPGPSVTQTHTQNPDGTTHTEVRITDPDSGGQKGSKPARFDLIPHDSLWQVAELYGKGAEKYSCSLDFGVPELVAYLLKDNQGEVTCRTAPTIRIEKLPPEAYARVVTGDIAQAGPAPVQRTQTGPCTLGGYAGLAMSFGYGTPTLGTPSVREPTPGSGTQSIPRKLEGVVRPGEQTRENGPGMQPQRGASLCEKSGSPRNKRRFFWNSKEISAESARSLSVDATAIWTMTIEQDSHADTYVMAATEDSVSWGTLWRVLNERGFISRNLQFVSYSNGRVQLRKSGERNWEKGYAFHLSFAAMMRHAWQFWSGEDIDKENGCHHLAAVCFHALALMAFQKRGIGKDDRPCH